MIQIMDWHGKKKEIPPIRTGLPEIPDDAVLHSLNWGQSASNEYECFVFNLSCDEDGCYISGKYVVSENDRHTEREAVPLTDEQRHSIERCLREYRHSSPPVRHTMKRYTTKPAAAFLYAGKQRMAAVCP